MAPGGVETSVFQNTIFPESASVEFSFDTPAMRIFKLIVCWCLLCFDWRFEESQRDQNSFIKQQWQTKFSSDINYYCIFLAMFMCLVMIKWRVATFLPLFLPVWRKNEWIRCMQRTHKFIWKACHCVQKTSRYVLRNILQKCKRRPQNFSFKLFLVVMSLTVWFISVT